MGGTIKKHLIQRYSLKHRSCFLFRNRLTSDLFFHIQFHLKTGNRTVMDGRSLNAAAGAHVHLNKAARNLAADHTLAQVNAVTLSVYIELAITVLF